MASGRISRLGLVPLCAECTIKLNELYQNASKQHSDTAHSFIAFSVAVPS